MSRTLIQTARPHFGASATRGAHISIADRVFDAFVGTLLRWSDRIQQRQALAEMDARMLSDIGVSTTAAVVEARKPFWSA